MVRKHVTSRAPFQKSIPGSISLASGEQQIWQLCLGACSCSSKRGTSKVPKPEIEALVAALKGWSPTVVLAFASCIL